MQDPIPAAATTELHAAFLQAVITLGLAALCGFIYGRYRKPYFAWWAAAWGLYMRPDRRHRQLPPHRRLDLALLAPGGHRAGPRSRCSTPPWCSPAGSAGGTGISRWCSSRRCGRTSPSTVSTTSSGPWGRRSSSSASRPCGPGGCSSATGERVAPAALRSSRSAFLLWGLHHLDYPVPACPRRLESLGLLHRHPAHPRRRRRHPAPGARRPAPRPRAR